MPINRRNFLNLLAGTAVASLVTTRIAHGAPTKKVKAIAFDAFPIFDPRPIFALAETLFPGKGNELSNAWRVRQFEYQWLRALGDEYVDFFQATEDALVFAAESLKLELTAEKRKMLMDGYLSLKVWPEVPSALQALKQAGFRLGFLSNATPKILQSGIKNNGLEQIFEHVLSTDAIRTYKPDQRAYQMGVKAFGLKKEDILFVAFAGWDVAGAKWFGYPTFWVNRMNLPPERLGAAADGAGGNLNDLVQFVTSKD